MTASIHVEKEFVSTSSLDETRLRIELTGSGVILRSITATTYDTIQDVVTAVDAAISGDGGSASISSSGYVTITFGATWKPSISGSPGTSISNGVLWDILGFPSSETYSLALTQTAPCKAKLSVWFDSFSDIMPDNRTVQGQQAFAVSGKTKQVYLSNTKTKAIATGLLNADHYKQGKSWYSEAQNGSKVTLNVDGTETEWILSDDSMKGLSRVIKRSSRYYRFYDFNCGLIEYA